MISIAIIARNEEQTIAECIDSASFCSDIVVLVNGSTDQTAQIAKEKGAQVVSYDGPLDFAEMRNTCLSHAKYDFVFFLDADERMSPELQHSLQQLRPESPLSAYRVRRIDHFWGKVLRFGEVQSAKNVGIIRLVKKGTGSFEGTVHEEWKTKERVSLLEGNLLHFPHPTISEFVEHINIYSTIRATDAYKNGQKASILSFTVFPVGKFIYTYFFKGGFRDGAQGFVYSFLMSFHSFLYRSKLFLMRHEQTS